MAFELMPLPYDSEALDPAISARTLGFHHGKHHKAYIDKTNAAVEGTDLAGKSLTDVIAAARGSNQGLFDDAAQSWNHGFYWNSLAPSGGSPSGDLASKINSAFGSLDRAQEEAGRAGRRAFRQRLGVAGRERRTAVARGNPRRRHAGRQRLQPAADHRCVGARLLLSITRTCGRIISRRFSTAISTGISPPRISSADRPGITRAKLAAVAEGPGLPSRPRRRLRADWWRTAVRRT